MAAIPPPTDDEKAKFVDSALKELEDKDQLKKFEDNVKEVAVWANEIDAAFSKVTHGFQAMVDKSGKDFPELNKYLSEWKDYNKRWVQYLATSRDVASGHIAILKRFDKVFLELVEEIRTDQDRLDVIVELKAFINEDYEGSVQLSRNFLELKRDIEDFVIRFDKWIVETGTKLEEEAVRLKDAIERLNGEIGDLDGKIKAATIALAACGGLLNVIGVIVAGSTLAVYQSQRKDKVNELENKKKELADVNRKQKDLANLKTQFDGLRPDINLICEKLILFAEIWSAVRSLTVQFTKSLEGGMGAVTNIRFKKEIRLAREVCTPLVKGLEKYAMELENRAA